MPVVGLLRNENGNTRQNQPSERAGPHRQGSDLNVIVGLGVVGGRATLTGCK